MLGLAYIRSIEATVINCNNNACDDNDLVPEMKCCRYEDLLSDEFDYHNISTITHPSRYVTTVTHSLDIQQFIITNSNISKIPRNLFQNIIDLKYLDVVQSGVRNIFVTDFFGANKLIHLNLTKNAIKTLEPKLFVHAQNLLTLDLSFNDITSLSEYAFDHLDKLKKLIISNNKLIAFETHQRFNDLEVFHINHNLLNEIGEAIFQNSSKLREINLRNNILHMHHLLLPKDVVLDTFDISNNLASISISSKQVSIQNTSTLTYIVNENVEILDASNNQISNIEFESNTHLTKLNLSNNNLTSVRNITHINNLQQLDLSYNSIKDFAISSFSEMNKLNVLNLKKSGLTSLDFGTFSQQTNLISLDISDNNLKKINFDMLLFMSSLSVLYIDGNQLTNIDVLDIKDILPNLKTISISRNLFKCHDLISIMKTLNSHHINMNMVIENIVKHSSNIRGISCFSDSNGVSVEKSTKIVEITTESTLDLNLGEQIYELNQKMNNSIKQSQKELINLKNNLQSLKKQLEKSLNEQIQNLSSFHDEYVFSKNDTHSVGSDSFQLAVTFLVIVLILFLFGIALFLFVKYRASARRRWYTSAKENSASADQTLV